ncbi:hypothetical protein [Streptomyces sp. NPDC053560]|uniref:hypothetical protein n=1 Tax=Streptomyces sp. NPDC053560 TaxID=3365711 RepID=UPI0037D3F7FA
MPQPVGSVLRDRFDELVTASLKSVQVVTHRQFALDDIALETEPLRSHGGHRPVEGEDTPGAEASLRLFSEAVGLSRVG